MAITGGPGRDEDAATVAQAIELLRSGGVVALPTDTVYGLAVQADRPDACARLFAVKGRPESVPLPVLCGTADEAASLVDPAQAEMVGALADVFWPGALTIVVRRRPGLDWRLGGDEVTIGLRVPNEPAMGAIFGAVGPLAVTSANRHGRLPCTTAAAVRAELGSAVAVLDRGTRANAASTVVDCSSRAPILRREGGVSFSAVCAVLGVGVEG